MSSFRITTQIWMEKGKAMDALIQISYNSWERMSSGYKEDWTTRRMLHIIKELINCHI